MSRFFHVLALLVAPVLLLTSAVAAAAGTATPASAAAAPAAATPVASKPAPHAASAASTAFDALTRRRFVAAWDAARLRRDGSWRALAIGLESYPLYPYIEHAVLVRALAPADADEVTDFLQRHDGSLLADDLRTRWLTLLAERGHWREFERAWRPRDALALRCAHVDAQIHLDPKADVAEPARQLWRHGSSLPDTCDAVIAWLDRRQLLTPALVWDRILLAAAAHETTLMASLAKRLPAGERAEAEAWSRIISNPQAGLAGAAGGKAERTRALALVAIERLARRDHAGAAKLWPSLSQRFAFDANERARAIGAIALWKAANNAVDASAWMRQVPWDHADDNVREWRVREALSRGALKETAQALTTLSPTQQLDPRWRYLRARLLEIGGQAEAARAAYTTLADEANYHGFLAAEHVGKNRYAICELRAPDDVALRTRVEGLPGLRRAFELHAIERETEARREWDHTVAGLPVGERALAVELAQARDWLDRGPLTLLRPEEIRYYALRFPLGHADTVAREARHHAVDTALVYGIIRAESAWVTDARSTADARGLMQLLPANAPRLAKLEHRPYGGKNDLFRPTLNIELGTRHLAEVLARYDDRAWLAAASYNAGPAPVDRWLGQRSQLPVDLWIETIPYRETREYVARVLAFSVIYDWRLHGDAASLAARLGLRDGAGGPARLRVACAVPPTAAVAKATETP